MGCPRSCSWIALGSVLLGCGAQGEAREEGARPSSAVEESRPGGARGQDEPASCGDFVCGWGEACESCELDCGDCSTKLSFWLTEPVRDASSALNEETVGDLEQALLADLEAAGEEILVASYALSRQNIADKLEHAAGREVDVRLVTECENRDGAQGKLLGRLEASGVSVRDDRSSFGGLVPDCPEDGGTMHHKFVIIDRHLVWAGSANLTATDLNYNHNHAFRIDDELVAAHFQAEWEELWAGHFGIQKQESAVLTADVGGSRLERSRSRPAGPLVEPRSVERCFSNPWSDRLRR